MSRSEPTTSKRSSLVFRYMPCKEGVAGLGSTTLETEETTSFRALVCVDQNDTLKIKKNILVNDTRKVPAIFDPSYFLIFAAPV